MPSIRNATITRHRHTRNLPLLEADDQDGDGSRKNQPGTIDTEASVTGPAESSALANDRRPLAGVRTGRLTLRARTWWWILACCPLFWAAIIWAVIAINR